MIEEGFNRSSAQIEIGLAMIREMVEKHQDGVLKYIKMTVFNIFTALLDLMPEKIKPYTDMMFVSIRAYNAAAMAEREAAYRTETETES